MNFKTGGLWGPPITRGPRYGGRGAPKYKYIEFVLVFSALSSPLS